MKSFKLHLAVVLLLTAFNAKSQTIENMDPTTITALDNTILTMWSGLGLKGMSLAVIYDGGIAFAKGYGNENEANDPFTINTKTPIASVSKTITAVIAMRLVQEGHLGLNDAISEYIQDEDFNGMAIRHLLSHQSGIGHYSNCPDGYDGPFNASASLTVVSGCTTCMAPPGAGTLYSTFGTTLLGVIIDQIASDVYNSSYEGLYTSWIENPSGAFNLEPAFDNSDSQLAQGYTESGFPMFGDWEDIGWRLPAGGFISNVTDLARFGMGVLNNTFINQSTFDEMVTAQPNAGGAIYTCDGSAGTYGLGWRVSGSGADLQMWHTGLNNHGYSSLLFLYPGKNAGIVLLANEANEVDKLTTVKNALEDIILCPLNRTFDETINWDVPNTFTSGNDINLSSYLFPTNETFTFDAKNEVRLFPGTRYLTGRSVVIKTDGCN